MSESVALFRKLFAIYQVYYYLHFGRSLEFVFGQDGMVDRGLLRQFDHVSLLFTFPQKFFLYLAYSSLLLLTVLFGAGFLSRPWVWLLFVLNVSFHNANPYIIHEPQQLASIFLFVCAAFLPTRDGEQPDPFVVRTMVIALGIYYLVAGLKKLPDPLWLGGKAVGTLLQWNALSGWQLGVSWLQLPIFNKIATYSTLVFEITFVFFCLSRWRFAWLAVGVVMHLMIALKMDVGTFSFIMLVWYALAWNLRPPATVGNA